MSRGLDELLNLLLQEMLAIPRVIWVTGFVEMALELVETRLGKRDSQGDGLHGRCAAKVDPVMWRRDRLFEFRGDRVRVGCTRSGEGLKGAKDESNEKERRGKEWTHYCSTDTDTGTVARWGKKKKKQQRSAAVL